MTDDGTVHEASSSSETRAAGLRCPHCRSGVHPAAAGLTCVSCRAEFPWVAPGIPDLSADRFVPDGPIPRPTLVALLRRVGDLGWRAAVREVIGALPIRAQRDLIAGLEEDQAGWKYLLDVAQDKRVLDYGSGVPAVAAALARSFGEVVALEGNPDSLRFLREWCRLQSLGNVSFVRGGDTAFLPFPDAHFDVVVLNGTLKWIPFAREGDPRRAQGDCLAEVRRVLKPEGECYLGTENRFGYPCLTGTKDETSGLRFGSLLPRPVARAYSHLVRKAPFRSYTYSRAGYERLLQRAGFVRSRFYAPYPEDRRFSEIVGLAGRRGASPRLMSGGGSARRSARIFRSGLAAQFAPSFSIVAQAGARPRSFLERLVPHALRDAEAGEGRVWTIRHLLVTSGKVVVVPQAGADLEPPAVIIKIPMTPYAAGRLRRNAEALRALHESGSLGESLRRRVPRSIESGSLAGVTYSVEQRIPGVSGEGAGRRPEQTAALMTSALELLGELHRAERTTVTVDPSVIRDRFLAPVLQTVEFVGHDPQCAALTRITAFLEQALSGRRLPLVWSHGDFSLKNLLVDEVSLDVQGVIDWDLSVRSGLPLLDLLHLVIRSTMQRSRLSFADAVLGHLFPLRLRGIERDLLDRYLATFGIDPALVTPLAVMYWISRIHGHVGSLKSLDLPWVERNFTRCVLELGRRL